MEKGSKKGLLERCERMMNKRCLGAGTKTKLQITIQHWWPNEAPLCPEPAGVKIWKAGCCSFLRVNRGVVVGGGGARR